MKSIKSPNHLDAGAINNKTNIDDARQRNGQPTKEPAGKTGGNVVLCYWWVLVCHCGIVVTADGARGRVVTTISIVSDAYENCEAQRPYTP